MKSKHGAALAAVAALCAVLTVALGQTGLFQLIHLKARDLNFVFRGEQPVADIVLITIDQHSLDTLPEPLMFWHPYYADVIRAAADAGAKAAGLDVTFAIPVDKWAPGHDQMLAAAVIETAARMPVICSYAPSTLGRQGDWPVPLNMMAAATGRGGFSNLRVDGDDFVRGIELMEEPREGSPPAKSLSLKLAEAFTGEEAKFEQGAIYFRGQRVPEVAPRTMQIDYRGPAGTFPRVSLSDVVEAYRKKDAAKLREWLGGRVALIGSDTIDDRHATPFYALRKDTRANTAGVEIQANAVSTLLRQAYLREPPPAVRWGLLALMAGICALAGGVLQGHRLGWAGLGVASLVFIIPQTLFRNGWVVAGSELFTSAALTALGVFLLRSVMAEKRGALFHRAVSVFVGGRLARVLEETGMFPVDGARQPVTILFTDIRGFTAWCESKDPATVVETLNGYFSAMVPPIVKQHGMVDKFIGDGIMAIFTDEEGMEKGSHAIRAVRAAMEMVKIEVGTFKTGAGIHTGDAVIGTVGSKDKMDFTALGDTVNLASRLESMNKEKKTKLLMSETTEAMLNGMVPVVCRGEVQVRGKSEPLKIYTAAELIPPPETH